MTDDIAALIERHSQVIDVPGDPLSKETIVALRTLAQENERLKTPRTPPDFENILDGASKIQKRRIIELEAERDALRAKTIEECAKIADSFRCGCCGMDGKSGSA